MWSDYRRVPYESKSHPGTWYRVDCFAGRYDCDCPGPQIARDGVCRHMRLEAERDERERNMTTNAVAIRDNTPTDLAPIRLHTPSTPMPTTEELTMMKTIAATVLEAGAGMVPDTIKTPQAALAVMLRGFELGFPPMASLTQIFPVNGRTELFTQGLISLVRQRDPSAKFIFHKYDQQGADVELIRGGESIIRVSYGKADRDLSKQGMKKRGQWKDVMRNGQPVMEGGRTKRYFEAVKNPDGSFLYDPDEESPWTKYPRDMFAYNAIKRCVRLGAPDCVNLMPLVDPQGMTPEQRIRILEEPAPLPTNPLHKALVEGTVSPAQVMGGDDSEPPPTAPEADATEPSDENAAPGPPDEAQTAAPPVAVDDDGPASEEAAAAMHALLVRSNKEFPSDYLRWYRALIAKYMPAGASTFDYKTLTARQAREALTELRGFRGEVDRPEEVMTTDEQQRQGEQPTAGDAPVQEPEPGPQEGAGDAPVEDAGMNAGAPPPDEQAPPAGAQP